MFSSATDFEKQGFKYNSMAGCQGSTEEVWLIFQSSRVMLIFQSSLAYPLGRGWGHQRLDVYCCIYSASWLSVLLKDTERSGPLKLQSVCVSLGNIIRAGVCVWNHDSTFPPLDLGNTLSVRRCSPESNCYSQCSLKQPHISCTPYVI